MYVCGWNSWTQLRAHMRMRTDVCARDAYVLQYMSACAYMYICVHRYQPTCRHHILLCQTLIYCTQNKDCKPLSNWGESDAIVLSFCNNRRHIVYIAAHWKELLRLCRIEFHFHNSSTDCCCSSVLIYVSLMLPCYCAWGRLAILCLGIYMYKSLQCKATLCILWMITVIACVQKFQVALVMLLSSVYYCWFRCARLNVFRPRTTWKCIIHMYTCTCSCIYNVHVHVHMYSYMLKVLCEFVFGIYYTCVLDYVFMVSASIHVHYYTVPYL